MENNHKTAFRVAFFDMAHSPCVIFNKNMILLDINNKALQILNVKKEKVLGKKVIDVFPSIESREPFKAYLEVIETGIPIDDKVRLNLKEKDFYFLARAFKVGEGLGLVGVDITENMSTMKELRHTRSQLKTANKSLKNSNEELDELSYVSAHDLKAHLTNVNNLLEMLDEDKAITTSGKPIFLKVLGVVDVMLAKLSALNNAIALKSHFGDAKKTISFQDILDNITNEIGKEILRTNTTINADFSKCPDIYINAFQLHSLMYNLIINSIKYRRVDKDPVIEISTKTQKRKTLIKIKDNGLGFNKKLAESKIFELFRRMHTHVEGLGVGLYMVKSIVRSHGGRINVSSRPNMGTTFELTI